MRKFQSLQRSPAIAALFCLALTTAACAQRVAPPAPPPPLQAPVVQAPKAAAPAPVAAAPKPVAAPKPAPVVKAAPPPPPAPKPVVEAVKAPEPAPSAPQEVTIKLPPAPEKPAEAAALPVPEVAIAEPALTAPASPPPPPAPEKVEIIEPTPLSKRYAADEAVTDDYASTVGEANPTPDSILNLDFLFGGRDKPDEPEEKAIAEIPQKPQPQQFAALETPPMLFEPPQVPVAPAPQASQPVVPDPVAEIGAPDEVQPESDAQQAPITPQPANILDPNDEKAAANPYPGSFSADTEYDTAELARVGAPAPSFAGAGYDPNAPVTIAILTPDSDPRAAIRALAKGLSNAAALSAKELGNRRIVLRGYDTGGSPEKASIAAQQAIRDGAKLIIGPLFSGSAAAVAGIAQSAGVPVIAFTTDQAVLRRGVYTVGYLPSAEVERSMSYIAQRGLRKVALLAPDTPYGGIVFRSMQDAAQRYGVEIATTQPISSDFSRADATAKRFAEFYAANPDVKAVMIATSGKSLQAIAAYLAYNDVLPSKVKYLGLGIWDDKETFREATLLGGWFPGLDPALKADFEGRYSAAYGEKPPAIATLAYDGVAIAGALLKAASAGNRAPFSIPDIETASGFRGMSGLFRFLPDGRNERMLSMLKVGRRQFEVLEPAPTGFNRRVTSISGYSQ